MQMRGWGCAASIFHPRLWLIRGSWKTLLEIVAPGSASLPPKVSEVFPSLLPHNIGAFEITLHAEDAEPFMALCLNAIFRVKASRWKWSSKYPRPRFKPESPFRGTYLWAHETWFAKPVKGLPSLQRCLKSVTASKSLL